MCAGILELGRGKTRGCGRVGEVMESVGVDLGVDLLMVHQHGSSRNTILSLCAPSETSVQGT